MISNVPDLSRRRLAQTVLFGAAAAALPAVASAAPASPEENIVFSKDHPGAWAGKEGTHVPVAKADGGMLTVTTPHVMTDAHYIVSHTVVLEDGKLLGRKTFTPKDMPVSTYTLPASYKGKVTVTSTCNQHDFWVSSLTV